MTVTTTITFTKDDLFAIAKAKGFLTDSDFPTFAVNADGTFVPSAQTELVQVASTKEVHA